MAGGLSIRMMAAIAMSLVLAACGGKGGGSSSSSTSSGNLTGIVAKGLISGATVTAYDVAGGAKGPNVLGTATTDTAGNYAINVGTYTGPVLVEVNNGSYTDEATGLGMTLGTTLRTGIANFTGAASANVTPFTEAAIRNALVAPGGLTVSNIQASQDAVQRDLGFNALTTMPAIATSTTAATDATLATSVATPSGTVAIANADRAYGAYLAGFSQYLKENPTKTLASALADLAAAFAAGGLENFPAITTAVDHFLSGNSNNQSGFTSYAALKSPFQTAPKILRSITVTPGSASVAVGASQQLAATATFDNATTADVTGNVTWASGNASVASVNSSGVALGAAAGSATITATLGSVSGSTVVTVTP